jgi:hypothetical protein
VSTPRLELKLDPLALRRAGARAVEIILQRTQQQHRDADGRPFKPYSTRDLALPLGAIPKNVQARLRRDVGARRGLRRLSIDDGLNVFTSQRGTLWAIIEGGYAAYKKARYPQDDGRVNLTASGAMLRALRVVRVTAHKDGGTVTLGFSRDEAAQIAYYHEVEGAGPSRVRRRIMGLTPPEQADVAGLVADGISVVLK